MVGLLTSALYMCSNIIVWHHEFLLTLRLDHPIVAEVEATEDDDDAKYDSENSEDEICLFINLTNHEGVRY